MDSEPTASAQDLARLLQAWLDAPTYRQERQHLESHTDLFDPRVESMLQDALAQAPSSHAVMKTVSYYLALLTDIRQRGATITAIRDAYVDRYGGLVLDIPQWLENNERINAPLNESMLTHDPRQRVAHWESVIARIRADASCEPEILAEACLQLWEARSLVGGDPWDLEGQLALVRTATAIYMRERYPRQWARAMIYLGNTYNADTSDTTDGGNEQNEHIESATSAYQEALSAISPPHAPVLWGWACHNLGRAYIKRQTGNKTDNIEQAISWYSQALAVREKGDAPLEWARTQHQLGNALRQRGIGDPYANREQALSALRATLEIYDRDRYAQQWAAVQHDIGVVYAQGASENIALDLEHAIFHYQLALDVLAAGAPTLEWARLQTNLGLAYWKRIEGERADNIEQAIACFSACLQYYSRAQFRSDWALIQTNLGAAYLERLHGSRAANIEQAIPCFDRALTIYTRDDFPALWAQLQHNLAHGYSARLQGNKGANIEQAIVYATNALSIRTPEAMPYEWAETTVMLATALQERTKGNRGEHIAQAIRHFTTALNVFTREAMPLEWARTHANLASAYQQWPYGRRVRNLEEALVHARLALEVLTPERTPIEWAKSISNLSSILLEQTTGDRDSGIEHAISGYRGALEVLTRERAPFDWAAAQMGLGSAYLDQIAGDRHDNLERAISCFEQALDIYTRDAAPIEWARIQANLGKAYAHQTYLMEPEFLTRALAHFEAALEVWTLEDFPEQHRDLQLNVAMLLIDEIPESMHASTSVSTDRMGHLPALCNRAHSAFAIARRVQTELGWLEYDAQGRASLQGATPSTRDMYACDAWCLWQLGEIEQAIAVLEAGRAIALTEAQAIAGVRPGDLCGMHASRFAAIRAAWDAARKASTTTNVWSLTDDRTRLRVAREDFLSIRDEIRHCDGCDQPDFLPDEPSYRDVSAASPSATALIYVTPSLRAGMAFVIPPQDEDEVGSVIPRGPLAIPLPELTSSRVLAWLLQVDSTGMQRRGYYLALEQRGMRLVEQCYAQWYAEQSEAGPHTLSLAQLPHIIPSDMETLRTASEGVVIELTAQEMLVPEAEEAGLAQKGKERSQVDLPVQIWLEDRSLRAKLSQLLAWQYQRAELDVLLPELREALMEPLQAGLLAHGLGDPGQRIALIPCGRLGIFPLHAVPVGSDNTPFGETSELSYQASARSLKVARSAADQLSHRGPLLAIGNPWPPVGGTFLPTAEREAIAIAALARQAGYFTSTYIVGAAATRARVLKELSALRARGIGGWLHLAGHGRANVYEPEESYLLLSGADAQGKPERLSMAMLQRERLMEGIWGVTASGCVTGLGDIEQAPDELSSLAASLVQAGAITVIASLWAVKDYATGLLMARFHQIRLGTPLDPPAALREATHWLRTATRAELDHFARQVDLPLLSSVDSTRDPLRGMVHTYSAEPNHLRTERSSIGVSSLAQVHANTSLIASLETGTEHDIPYAHPIYWAAMLSYGL